MSLRLFPILWLTGEGREEEKKSNWSSLETAVGYGLSIDPKLPWYRRPSESLLVYLHLMMCFT